MRLVSQTPFGISGIERAKENPFIYGRHPPIGKLSCQFGKGHKITEEMNNNAVADVEELGEFSDIIDEESC